jgi:wyosine [tRNA(Phe)-imidazoG37] synthetase (radical SAM superfamily)
MNRPHSTLKVQQIIEGLKKFRLEFQGKIWLEILLVKSVNDSPSHIQKLKKVAFEINPDRIQLNTVVRPPAEKSAFPLKPKELEKIKTIFGKKAEIVAEFDKIHHLPVSYDLEDKILAMVARRPVTLADISRSLGKRKNELIKYCDVLLEEGKIKLRLHEGKKFYESYKQENKPNRAKEQK